MYRECWLACLRITSCWRWWVATLATVWWVTHRMTTGGIHIRLPVTCKFNILQFNIICQIMREQFMILTLPEVKLQDSRGRKEESKARH